ncbi:MAG TPA: hypothetical protein VLE20_10810, partial [Blastocatellia bacterium]|nr:hypothetical protein [Blastocatellia bacterium]
MLRITIPLPKAFCLSLMIALSAVSTFAHAGVPPGAFGQEAKQTQTDDRGEKRKARRARKTGGSKDPKTDQQNPSQSRDSKSTDDASRADTQTV